MKLISLTLLVLTKNILSLRIELEDTDADTWNERQIKQIPKPVLGAFADHLHTIASLFSSLIGTGVYKDPEDDALDCQHTSLGFGPYCEISYSKDQKCYQEFGCEFYDANIKFSNQDENAKLCCFKNYDNLEFENTFIDQFNPEQPLRIFQANQNNVGKIYKIGDYDIQVIDGHFGLAELIYIPNKKADTESTIIDTWSGCPFDDAVGYHSIKILPGDNDEYETRELDNYFIQQAFTMCTVEGNGTKLDISGNEDIKSHMPYCTFKLIGQDCPQETPLAMNFEGTEYGHILPNDKMFEQLTYIDSSTFCCAKSNHDTSQTTIVNVDYIKNQVDSDPNASIYDFFKSRYQVLKWPHADCAQFEYPEFDLSINTVKLSNKNTYPWGYGNMDLTFCTYTKPRTLDEIFSTSSTFDETLSQIDISGLDIDAIVNSEIGESLNIHSVEEILNNSDSNPCDGENDCYVPPAVDVNSIISGDVILATEASSVINTDNSGQELPSIIVGSDHIAEYFDAPSSDEFNGEVN